MKKLNPLVILSGAKDLLCPLESSITDASYLSMTKGFELINL
ncbi:hypothetical protein [Mucilaginibacter lappiensis]|uniref:Uncharacterized protein n=1 Tax=Mucilaginibacter lappiensis TaxID=354630 RepID=A0A841JDG7_9SPHI|nr:hypothetical protein [Mucilaginibacter lappiensis]MBB6126648.1 hypothetical protein [Mucilaginibacter lappiensis]